MSAVASGPKFAAPYPGLRPFEADEAPLFFGRGKQIAAMIRILRQQHFLAVVGSSGSGKSSLVRAGLLPALTDGCLGGPNVEWRFAVFRPGTDPTANLCRALVSACTLSELGDPTLPARRLATLKTGPGGLIEAVSDSLMPENIRLLVLVDQFEELFRYARQIETRDDADGATNNPFNQAVGFVDQLLWTINKRDPRVYVALTMRSDFLGDCDAFRNLPEAVTRSQFLTPRLNRAELRDAIERPLVGFGEIQSEVTLTLLNEVGSRGRDGGSTAPEDDDVTRSSVLFASTGAQAKPVAIGAQADVLPLMQHALLRMWTLAKQSAADTNEPPEIRLEHYQSSGGFEHALSIHATEVYEGLADGEAAETCDRRLWLANRTFCSLCEQAGQGRRVRRPATVGQIAAEADASPREIIDVAARFLERGVNILMASPPGPLTQETLLDISHESLIRQWNLLGGWLDEEQASASLYERLVSSARLHAKGHAEPLPENELGHVDEWLERRKPNAAWAERYAPRTYSELVEPFIDVSRQDVRRKQEERHRLEMERQAAEQQKQELEQTRQVAEVEKSRAKILRRMSFGIGCVAVVAVGLAAYAAAQRANAEKSRDDAQLAHRTAKKAEEDAKRAQWIAERAQKDEKAANRKLEAANNQVEYEKNIVLAKESLDEGSIGEALQILQAIGGEEFKVNRGWEHDLLKSMANSEETSTLGSQNLIAFSSDGAKAVGVDENLVTALWNLDEVPESFPLDTTSTVSSAAFSLDGQRVVCGTNVGTLLMWDVSTRQQLLEFGNDSYGLVSTVAFDRGGTRIASGSDDGTMRIWDAATGAELQTKRVVQGICVKSVAFSPDGTRFVCGLENGKVCMGPTPPLGDQEPLFLDGLDGEVTGVAFDSTGRHVIGSDDNQLVVWNAENRGKEFASDGPKPGTYFLDLAEGVRVVTAVSSAERGRATDFLTITFNGRESPSSVVSGIAASGHETKGRNPRILAHDNEVFCLAFSPDGTRIATGGRDDKIRVWDLLSGKEINWRAGQTTVQSIAFSQDGSSIASGGGIKGPNPILVWDAKTGEVKATLKGHKDWVRCLAFTPDSQLISGSDDRSFAIWNIEDESIIAAHLPKRRAIRDWLWDLVLVPQTSRFIAAWEQSDIQEWDFKDATNLRQTSGPFEHVKGPRGSVFCLAINTKGTILASGGDDRLIKLWEVGSTGNEPDATLNGHSDAVRSLSFHPKENRLASGSDDGTIRIWDTQTGRSLLTLHGHEAAVFSVRFSPDGKRLASASIDRTVKIWDASGDQETQPDQSAPVDSPTR